MDRAVKLLLSLKDNLKDSRTSNKRNSNNNNYDYIPYILDMDKSAVR